MSWSKPIFLYNNLLKLYTPTVTTEDSDYPKENLYDDQLQSLYKPTGSGDARISIDAGADVAVDAFCIGNAHNLNTVSATVTLQWSATGAWAGEESDAFTGFDPASDNSYQYKLFSSLSKRYWSIKLSGMSGIPEIGEVAFGARYTLPKYFDFGFDKERHIKGNTNIADGGQVEDITKHKRSVFPCSIKNIIAGTQDETDILAWRDFVEEGDPFWFFMDQGAAYDLYLVSMIERQHRAPFQKGSSRNFDFTLREEL